MLTMGLISGDYGTKASKANLTTNENNLKNKKIDKNKEVGVAPLSLIEEGTAFHRGQNLCPK